MSLVILTTRKTVGPFDIKERKPKLPGLTKYTVFKGDEQVKDFGRYSAAIRWCKGQLPREVPHVVVNLEDKSVIATVPIGYTLIDGPYVTSCQAIVDPARVALLTKETKNAP